MGLSTGRPWQAKHREIGIDLTAKKKDGIKKTCCIWQLKGSNIFLNML